jgi:hypothetical protein
MGLVPGEERDKGSYLTPALAILALLGWIARILSAPDWVFVVLLATTAPMMVWLAWTLLENRRNERSYPYPVLFLLLLLGWIAERLSPPTWIDAILIAAWVVVVPWVLWILVKNWRGGRSG